MKRPELTQQIKDTRLDLSRNEFYNPQYPSVYPDDYECYEQIERLFDIKKENLAIGFGADEIIGRCSKLFDMNILDFNQYEMSYVYNEMNSNYNTQKALYFGNPSNKSVTVLDKSHLKNLISEYNGIVIIDEVYASFNDYKYSLRYEIEDYPNLVIIDSTSKALGLPGIRCGFGIANTKLIEQIRSIRPVHICTAESIDVLRSINKKDIKKFQEGIMTGKLYLESIFDHAECPDVPYSLLYNIGDLEHKIKGRWINNLYRVSGISKDILMCWGIN